MGGFRGSDTAKERMNYSPKNVPAFKDPLKSCQELMNPLSTREPMGYGPRNTHHTKHLTPR